MATVTGFTSDRLLAMEAATVVDGNVVSGDLILETQGGGTINAGSVIGPAGPTGPPGDVSTAQMDAAIEASRALIQAANAVTSTMIAGLAITSAKLADQAVTSGKIADLNVTNGKLAANAVTTIKIADGAVTSAKQSFIFIQANAPAGVTGGIWFDT